MISDNDNSVPLQLCSTVIPSGSLNIEFNIGSQEAAKQGDSKLKGIIIAVAL